MNFPKIIYKDVLVYGTANGSSVKVREIISQDKNEKRYSVIVDDKYLSLNTFRVMPCKSYEAAKELYNRYVRLFNADVAYKNICQHPDAKNQECRVKNCPMQDFTYWVRNHYNCMHKYTQKQK